MLSSSRPLRGRTLPGARAIGGGGLHAHTRTWSTNRPRMSDPDPVSWSMLRCRMLRAGGTLASFAILCEQGWLEPVSVLIASEPGSSFLF